MKTNIVRGILGAALFAAALFVSGPGTETSGWMAEATAGDKGKQPPAGATGIEWQIEPEGVEIYVDGKKVGEAGKVQFTALKPGKHSVRLVRHKDETEIDVDLKKGQTLKFAFKFEDD